MTRFSRRIIIFACVPACTHLTTMPGAHAGDGCKCLIATIQPGEEVSYLPEAPELPRQVRFPMAISPWKTCDGEMPTDPKIRVVLLDSSGNEEIAQYEAAFAPTNCSSCASWTCGSCSSASPVEQDVVIDLPKRKCAKNYRIDRWSGCAGDLQPDYSDWHNGAPVAMPPLEFECPAGDIQQFMNELKDFTCRAKGVIAVDADLKFYKSTRTLYTLPTDDESGASYGEVVNGEFVAPADGLLVVTPDGASEQVDMYGSNSANGAGWQVPPDTRQGGQVSGDTCLALSAGEKYKFNIRAGKGDSTSRFSVKFRWYWWNSEECCLQHDERELDLAIESMLLDTVEPPDPQRNRLTRTEGVDVELRRPACGTEKKPGNLTQWFVMWPTVDGLEIQEGHAKRWKVEGDELVAPGPEGQRFDFSGGQ